MNQNRKKTSWFSSYEKNNYGDLFYSLIRVYQPKKVVELGTKAGYSAYHIARGLKDNSKGGLDCYDLWEKYPFKSVPKSVAEANLKKVGKYINFYQRDAVGVDKLYKSIDILHVDISNDGEILEKVVPHWIDKVGQIIVIEGGSLERDEIAWMVKYRKTPINKWLHNFTQKYPGFESLTIEPFPSITIIRKKK